MSSIKRRWPRRHPVWSALIAIVGLFIVISVVANPKPTKASRTTADAAPHSTATPTADRSSLKCRAQAASKQPRDHTTVTIKVHTVAHADVTATSRVAPLKNEHVTGSSNASGTWTWRVRVGDATPGNPRSCRRTRLPPRQHRQLSGMVPAAGGRGLCRGSASDTACRATVSHADDHTACRATVFACRGANYGIVFPPHQWRQVLWTR